MNERAIIDFSGLTTTPSDESETNLQGVKQKNMSTQELSEETKRSMNSN